MNTYKTRLIIALLCVANILGAEKKGALVCVGGSAESRPKSTESLDELSSQGALSAHEAESQDDLDFDLREAILSHDFESLQLAVQAGADVNAIKGCEICDCGFAEPEEDESDCQHFWCGQNMLELAVEVKNLEAVDFILRRPEFDKKNYNLQFAASNLAQEGIYNNPASVTAISAFAEILKPTDVIHMMPCIMRSDNYHAPENYRFKYLCLKESLKFADQHYCMPQIFGGLEYLTSPNFGKRDIEKNHEFTVAGCAEDCKLLDTLVQKLPKNDITKFDTPLMVGRSLHNTACAMLQLAPKVDKLPLDGMTLTLVDRLLNLPQRQSNKLRNLKQWQMTDFRPDNAIARQICFGQNSHYRTPLSSMLKILSACKAVSSNLDQSSQQLVCSKPSFFQPCGQAQLHRLLRTKIDEQNAACLAHTGCGFDKLVGPVCNQLSKVTTLDKSFFLLAIKTYCALGSLVPEPKELSDEDFADDQLMCTPVADDSACIGEFDAKLPLVRTRTRNCSVYKFSR